MKLGDLMVIYSAVMRMNQIEFRVDPGRNRSAQSLFAAIAENEDVALQYLAAVNSVRNALSRVANLQFTLNPDMEYRVVDRPKRSVDLNEV